MEFEFNNCLKKNKTYYLYNELIKGGYDMGQYVTDEEKMENLIAKEVEESAIDIGYDERPSSCAYEGWTYHYE